MLNLFYRNPRLTFVAVMLIVVAGLAAAATLPRMEDPRFTNRFGFVVTRWAGANSERIETLVTDKIEDELEQVTQIKELTSTSRAGVSVIKIELDDAVDGRNVDEVWSRIRDKLDDARPHLPPEASDPDFNNDETFAYTVIAALVWELEAGSSDASDASDVGDARGASDASDASESREPTEPNFAILRRLAEQLEDKLRGVPGTEHTTLFGENEEEIRVQISQAKLAELGLTPGELAAAVAGSDAKVAAGQLRSRSSDLLVEVAGEVEEIDRVRQVSLRFGEGGQFVRLGDIATVEKTLADPPSQRVLINGKPAVAVAVRMTPDTRVDQFSAKAGSIIDAFAAELSQGVGVEVIFDQADYTQQRLGSLSVNFALAVAAVIAVVLVLMGWRSAIIVGAALPLSALMVLGGMNVLGIPIHQMSVTGLIIALGLLIDNAIVVVDEIQERLGRGDQPADAIGGAVRLLAVPLGGSTLTTVIAFMPIVLMPGSAGEFVGAIALSVILALVSSLVLSLTVIAALSGWLYRFGGRRSGRHWLTHGISSGRLAGAYIRAIAWLLARPIAGVAIALVLPLAGFVVAGRLVEQFFPPADRDQFQVQLRLPRLTSIHATMRYVEAAGGLLMQHEQITDVHWFIGDGAPLYYYNLIAGEDDSPHFAQALVQMSTHRGGTQVIRDVQRQLNDALPQAEVLALQLEQGPPFDAPIELKLLGPDLEKLQLLGDEARRVMSQSSQIVHTRATLSDGRPKLFVQLDDQEARLGGLDNVEVARQLDAALEGAAGGSLIEATEQLPVRVRLTDTHRSSVQQIESIDLYATSAGQRPAAGTEVGNIPLSAVGRLELLPQVASIERRNGQRSNTVMGFIQAGVLPAEVRGAFESELAAAGFELPDGYEMAWGGEADQRDDAVANLMGSVAVLAVLMFTTLVISLGSLRLTGLIAAVAIAAVGLGLGALWLFGHPFGFMAIVGTLGLIGVAINDSIVVIAALKADEGARRGEPAAVHAVVMRSTRHVV